MSTETNVNSLIINKMSESKYSQITPVEGEMYATPDTHIATKEWTESRINDIMNTQKTNCVTYIPENIKLEFVEGTLTLKSGSKVTIPNGSNTFDTVTITSDKNLTNTFSGTYEDICICYDRSTGGFRAVPMLNSTAYGTTDYRSSVANHIWYDTTNNKIRHYPAADGVESSNQLSLPICTMTNVGGAGFKSIHHIFNGFGYIGNTIFIYPGVKGLVPDGWNDDGSYKNIEVETTRYIFHTYTYTSAPQGIMLGANNTHTATGRSHYSTNRPHNNWVYWYRPEENKAYYDYSGDMVFSRALQFMAITDICINNDNYTIYKFNPKKPCGLAYDNDIKVVSTLSAGATWCRTWSDGWCEQGSTFTPSADPSPITFLKPFKDTNYAIQISVQDTSPTDWALTVGSWNDKTTTGFNLYQGYNGSSQKMPVTWEAKGYLY